MKRLSIFLSVLVWILAAQPAHAMDVRATSVRVDDAEAGASSKYTLGRKLAVRCDYEYLGSATIPPWQIALQIDGVTFATHSAEIPSQSFNPNPFNQPPPKRYSVQSLVTPKTVGEHTATCLLDPGGKLQALDSDLKNNSWSMKFVVDVTPRVGPGQSGPVTTIPGGPTPMPPKGGPGAGSGPVAQGPTPVIVQAVMKLKLQAQPLANCGPGQDVVRVMGTLTNTGQGIAVIPAGKQVIKIDADVGVFGAGIAAPGTLASGQSVPVNANLKAKGGPSNLAGATVKLVANVANDAIKNASGDQQNLQVSFPANFCKPATKTDRTPNR